VPTLGRLVDDARPSRRREPADDMDEAVELAGVDERGLERCLVGSVGDTPTLLGIDVDAHDLDTGIVEPGADRRTDATSPGADDDDPLSFEPESFFDHGASLPCAGCC